MTVYVFFNKNTGQIIHTHREITVNGDPLQASREHLEELQAKINLRLPQEERIEPEELDILDVDENNLVLRKAASREDAKELYVDTQERVLAERETNRG